MLIPSPYYLLRASYEELLPELKAARKISAEDDIRKEREEAEEKAKKEAANSLSSQEPDTASNKKRFLGTLKNLKKGKSKKAQNIDDSISNDGAMQIIQAKKEALVFEIQGEWDFFVGFFQDLEKSNGASFSEKWELIKKGERQFLSLRKKLLSFGEYRDVYQLSDAGLEKKQIFLELLDKKLEELKKILNFQNITEFNFQSQILCWDTSDNSKANHDVFKKNKKHEYNELKKSLRVWFRYQSENFRGLKKWSSRFSGLLGFENKSSLKENEEFFKDLDLSLEKDGGPLQAFCILSTSDENSPLGVGFGTINIQKFLQDNRFLLTEIFDIDFELKKEKLFPLIDDLLKNERYLELSFLLELSDVTDVLYAYINSLMDDVEKNQNKIKNISLIRPGCLAILDYMEKNIHNYNEANVIFHMINDGLYLINPKYSNPNKNPILVLKDLVSKMNSGDTIEYPFQLFEKIKEKIKKIQEIDLTQVSDASSDDSKLDSSVPSNDRKFLNLSEEILVDPLFKRSQNACKMEESYVVEKFERLISGYAYNENKNSILEQETEKINFLVEKLKNLEEALFSKFTPADFFLADKKTQNERLFGRNKPSAWVWYKELMQKVQNFVQLSVINAFDPNVRVIRIFEWILIAKKLKDQRFYGFSHQIFSALKKDGIHQLYKIEKFPKNVREMMKDLTDFFEIKYGQEISSLVNPSTPKVVDERTENSIDNSDDIQVEANLSKITPFYPSVGLLGSTMIGALELLKANPGRAEQGYNVASHLAWGVKNQQEVDSSIIEILRENSPLLHPYNNFDSESLNQDIQYFHDFFDSFFNSTSRNEYAISDLFRLLPSVIGIFPSSEVIAVKNIEVKQLENAEDLDSAFCKYIIERSVGLVSFEENIPINAAVLDLISEVADKNKKEEISNSSDQMLRMLKRKTAFILKRDIQYRQNLLDFSNMKDEQDKKKIFNTSCKKRDILSRSGKKEKKTANPFIEDFLSGDKNEFIRGFLRDYISFVDCYGIFHKTEDEYKALFEKHKLNEEAEEIINVFFHDKNILLEHSDVLTLKIFFESNPDLLENFLEKTSGLKRDSVKNLMLDFLGIQGYDDDQSSILEKFLLKTMGFSQAELICFWFLYYADPDFKKYFTQITTPGETEKWVYNLNKEATPAVETSAVATPAVETPAVETPAVATPAAETPAVETPAVATPAVETPAVETPIVAIPAAMDPARVFNNLDNAPELLKERRKKEVTQPFFTPQDETPADKTPDVASSAVKAELSKKSSVLLGNQLTAGSNVEDLNNYISQELSQNPSRFLTATTLANQFALHSPSGLHDFGKLELTRSTEDATESIKDATYAYVTAHLIDAVTTVQDETAKIADPKTMRTQLADTNSGLAKAMNKTNAILTALNPTAKAEFVNQDSLYDHFENLAARAGSEVVFLAHPQSIYEPALAACSPELLAESKNWRIHFNNVDFGLDTSKLSIDFSKCYSIKSALIEAAVSFYDMKNPEQNKTVQFEVLNYILTTAFDALAKSIGMHIEGGSFGITAFGTAEPIVSKELPPYLFQILMHWHALYKLNAQLPSAEQADMSKFSNLFMGAVALENVTFKDITDLKAALLEQNRELLGDSLVLDTTKVKHFSDTLGSALKYDAIPTPPAALSMVPPV